MKTNDKLSEYTTIKDIKAEKDVLGEVMTSGRLSEVSDVLTADCFFFCKHQAIFRSIDAISSRGDVTSVAAIMAELPKHTSDPIEQSDVEDISLRSTDGLRQHALLLADYAKRRRLAAHALLTLKRCSTTEDPIDTIIEDTYKELNATAGDSQERFFDLRSMMEEQYQNIKDNMVPGQPHRGMETGFQNLDDIGGIQKTHLIVIAGSTAQGKTALALTMATNAIKNGSRVLYVSLEMSPRELATRILASESGVNGNRIAYRPLNEQELASTDRAIGKLEGVRGNLYVDSRTSSNLDTIIGTIRLMKMKHDIDGVVVDYLQILNVNMKSGNKEQAMGEAARRLKNIAMELDIWVMALSQLNRNMDNPEPTIDRLRDSGQIAEAANLLLLVYRPEYYQRQYSGEFKDVETHGTAEIKIAKARNGGTGRFICGFDAGTTQFYPLNAYPKREIINQDIF